MERGNDKAPCARTLTVHQVAERLNVSSRVVWAWIAAGRLKAIKLGPRTTRIPEEALGEFLRACPSGLNRGR
jgi:excisionase family DNA binding protein